MTPDRIQSASREYKAILERNLARAGGQISDSTVRALNGLIDYLATVAQIEDKTPLMEAAECAQG
jgi:hypothetical protein